MTGSNEPVLSAPRLSTKTLPVRKIRADKSTKDPSQGPYTLTPRDFVPEDDRFIQNSPYQEADHQTDLWALDWQQASIVLALEVFDTNSPDYASIPYKDCFNFNETVDYLREIVGTRAPQFEKQTYFIVAFRSKLKNLDVYTDLSHLDKAAHLEATRLGILKYWFGFPDTERRNLATCLWSNRIDAAKASHCPDHIEAVRMGTPMYEWFRIECYEFTVLDGLSGWTFEQVAVPGHPQ
ncbi:hypothetical protein BROUX41_004593 [Berkeleyomyces rouxiae]|uniref:uncharacterized protein n=1 Tax=Berkeleyomyces rouxiae TaxID=2035830 RepID=UPI003B788E3A